LNISSAFNSAVTVYVLIPLLLIPQMILSGLLFSFDKLNNIISTKGKVPIVADMMASRWAYEAMAVHQFKNNSFEEPFYKLDKIEAQSDFRASFLADELDKKRRSIADNIGEKNDSIRQVMQKNLSIIQNTIQNDFYKESPKGIDKKKPWTLDMFNDTFNKSLEEYFVKYKKFYQGIFNHAVAEREKLIVAKESDTGADFNLTRYKNNYYNESLADLVTNISEKNRLIEYDGELVQQINPIFLDPKPNGPLDYRAHFFAPQKNLFGNPVSTFWFNMLIIWIMTLFLYITLYFEWLKKLVNSFEFTPGKVSPSKVVIPKKK
jgi:ABC transport system ATP-binding/permease protein